MNRAIRSQTRRDPRLSIVTMVAAAATAGLISVLIIQSRDDEVRLRGTQGAAAEGAVTAPPADPGDSRIAWQALPTSNVSPPVADGDAVWFAALERIADDGTFDSAVFKATPSTGRVERIAAITGSPTAATRAGDRFAFGAGRSIYLVSRDGVVQSATVGDTPLVQIGEIDYIRALAWQAGRLVVGRANSTRLDILDGATLKPVGVVTLPEGVPPPKDIVALPGGGLLASSPFSVVSVGGPGAAVVDAVAFTAKRADIGRPFTFSGGGDLPVYASQSVPGGGMEAVSGDSTSVQHSTVKTAIPWNGKFDIVAVAAGRGTWGAVAGTDRVYFEDLSGHVTEFTLPIIRGVPSLPPGAKSTPEMLLAHRNIASMSVLNDGTVVLLSESPGGAIGFIRVP